MPLEDDLREYASSLAASASSALVEELRASAPVGATGGLLASIADPSEPEYGGGVLTVRVEASVDYAAALDEAGPHAGWWTDVVEAWPGFLEDEA